MTHLEQFETDLADKLKDREQEDLRKVLETVSGRRVLWSILDVSGVYSASFTGEALGSAYNEGSRKVGITILQKIESLAPGSYLTMQREALDEKQSVEALRQAAIEKDTSGVE